MFQNCLVFFDRDTYPQTTKYKYGEKLGNWKAGTLREVEQNAFFSRFFPWRHSAGGRKNAYFSIFFPRGTLREVEQNAFFSICFPGGTLREVEQNAFLSICFPRGTLREVKKKNKKKKMSTVPNTVKCGDSN